MAGIFPLLPGEDEVSQTTRLGASRRETDMMISCQKRQTRICLQEEIHSPYYLLLGYMFSV